LSLHCWSLTCLSAKNVLVFGLDSDRHDPYNTLETLATLLSEHVEGIVLTSDTGNSDNKRLATYSEIWRSHARDVKIKIADREQAMDCAREMGTQVFVTGSLFLVAFVLQKLNQSCT
jgi:folylpolyglutamate synthase/dihydropteroate synthase